MEVLCRLQEQNLLPNLRKVHPKDVPNYPEPEVIPPRAPGSVSDESLELLATLLDDFFRIPGTSIRFGLDPVVGLIPGLGDAISGVASFVIVFAAWQRRLPKITLARMVANIGIDTIAGSLPFFGDVFDAAWKSNRRNMELLKRSKYDPVGRQVWHDYVFIGLVAVLIALLVTVPLFVLWWLIHVLRRG